MLHTSWKIFLNSNSFTHIYDCVLKRFPSCRRQHLFPILGKFAGLRAKQLQLSRGLTFDVRRGGDWQQATDATITCNNTRQTNFTFKQRIVLAIITSFLLSTKWQYHSTDACTCKTIFEHPELDMHSESP